MPPQAPFYGHQRALSRAIIGPMASIIDNDRSVFREAANTILDNFTEAELQEAGTLASKLSVILKAAKERQQGRFLRH
jgi:hypothetical protein